MRQNLKYIFIVIGIFIVYKTIMSYKKFRNIEKYAQYETNGSSGKMENGLKQGEWRDYFVNGRLALTTNYKNDTLDGIRMGYTPNGELAFNVV